METGFLRLRLSRQLAIKNDRIGKVVLKRQKSALPIPKIIHLYRALRQTT